VTIASPYASAPRHPARYVLYLTRVGDASTSCMVKAFAAPYVARKFLDALLADDGYVWQDETTIRSETGVVVSTRWFPDALRACVEHRYTAAETAWTLDSTSASHARLFRHGPDVREAAAGGVEDVVRTPRPAPQPRAPRDGLVTVADIAAELGVEPRVARQALRGLGVEKPAAGWAWPASEAAAVAARVKAAL